MTETTIAEPGSADGDRELVEALMRRARADGVSLVGPGGLLTGLTKTVGETALEAELTEHLGYEPHERASTGNTRNGSRVKTVLTEVGPVEVEVPRDRDATFEPKIVRKRQRRLVGVDDLVVSLVAKGLTTGEVQAHLAEVYGSEVSRETISTITDRVLEGMVEWQNRPGLPGRVHRRDRGQDPRRAGREPADLHRRRGYRRRRTRHPRSVGRDRR